MATHRTGIFLRGANKYNERVNVQSLHAFFIGCNYSGSLASPSPSPTKEQYIDDETDACMEAEQLSRRTRQYKWGMQVFHL